MSKRNLMNLVCHFLDKNAGQAISTRLKARSGRCLCAYLLAILFLGKNSLAYDVVATFTPPGGPAPDLATYGIGFELYGSGLYWWQGDGTGGDLPNNSELGYKGVTSPSVPATRPLLSGLHQISGAARDDLSFYFAADKRIYTKALWAAQSDPETELTTAYTPLDSNHDLGAVMFWNGRFYWSDYQDAGSTFDIWSINPDGSGAMLVYSGNGGGTGGKILKMVGHTYWAGGLAFGPDAIFLLTATGQLTRLDVNPPAAPVVLGTGVADFAIRDESQQLFPFGFNFFTEVYMATGQKYGVSGSTPPGALRKVTATAGSPTTLYTASAQNQLTSIAADSANLYWTEQPIIFDSTFGWLLSGNYSMFRRSFPDDNSQVPGPVHLIGASGTGAGLNLRSDGQWLYSLYGNSVERISTQAPPLAITVQADGLEVVQALQDLKSDVPIVANRATYVRGYAHLSSNTTGKYNWFATALLHGFRNGIEFSDSPIHPIKIPPMPDNTWLLYQLREDTKKSYLFQLPDSWVAKSDTASESLNFTMTVNPDQQIPETASPPFPNDTVSLLAPANLVRGIRPIFKFVPLICTGPSYYVEDYGFNQILQREYSMLSQENDPTIWNVLSSDQPQGDYDNPFNFNSSKLDDFQRAVDTMDNLKEWYDGYAENDEHFIGMINQNANNGSAGVGGMGKRPGYALIATMLVGSGNGRTYGGGLVLAHELGHNYGHRHIDCGTFPASQQDFDTVAFPCSLGDPSLAPQTATFGFDSLTFQAIPPDTAADLMTYAASIWPASYSWYDYGITGHNSVPSPQQPPNGGPNAWYKHANMDSKVLPVSQQPPNPVPNGGPSEVLLVHGQINPDLPAASFKAFYLLPVTLASADSLTTSLQASDMAAGLPNPYYIVFLDGGGHLLSQVAIGADVAQDSPSDTLFFCQFVNFPTGASVIQLVQGTVVLAERLVNPNSPTLALGAPVLDNTAGTLHLDWTASDPDGNPLVFTHQYSPDGGATWSALCADYEKLGITFSTARWAGSTQALIRVIASDGVNTATAMTAPLTISNHPPEVVVGGVAEGQHLPFGGQNSLNVLVFDPQVNSVSNQFNNRLNWTVAGPTPLAGTSGNVLLTGLSPGNYTANFTATDALGLIGTAGRDFSILPPTIPEAMTAPVLDGLANDDGYTQATVISFPLEDGTIVNARMFHSSTNFYVSLAGLKFGGGTPRSVGLRLDPAPGSFSAPNSNVFGFFVDETGAPREERGNGTTMVTILSPVPGFAAAIYNTGSNSWSAEMCITDTLLGGWGHAAGLMLAHGVAHWPPNALSNSLASYGPVYLGTNAPPSPVAAPMANAGHNQLIPLGPSQSVYLNGSSSSDPQNLPLSYSWTQLSGTSVSLSGANGPLPTFATAPVTNNTQLVFQLIVNNGVVASLPSQVQVTLLPQPAKYVPPAQKSGVSLGANGQVHARLIGQPLMAYQIQASTDLMHWTTISTVYADYAGRIEFDASTLDPNFPIRFFRAYGP